VAYLFRLESTKKEQEMDLKGREYKSEEWHLSGLGQRPVPAVVSMGMNFWYPRFEVIP
jgi:hypothetical protein